MKEQITIDATRRRVSCIRIKCKKKDFAPRLYLRTKQNYYYKEAIKKDFIIRKAQSCIQTTKRTHRTNNNNNSRIKRAAAA